MIEHARGRIRHETVRRLSATGFTAMAKGNLDDDATCDEWSINEKKELLHTLDDMKD